MATIIPDIEFPELFLGFVSPIGVDLNPSISAFKTFLIGEGYHVEEIRVTEVFPIFEGSIGPAHTLRLSPEYERFRSHIKFGNRLREHSGDDAIVAALAIGQIMFARSEFAKKEKKNTVPKIAYLIRQFKRREEVELLRSVYGRLFFQISIYSRRSARVEVLSQRFAKSMDQADASRFRAKAEELVQTDENEVGSKHGQQVGKIFHDADFVINSDISTPSTEYQIKRFCETLFSSNSISPTKQEFGMFMAKAAALKTTDLSRQVGAAIFSSTGEILCMGCNEVPKAGGGAYWEDEDHDDRDYKRGFDANDRRKKELLRDLATRAKLPKLPVLPGIEESQFMDALEYGRIVHAEMAAITDAARLGVPTKGTTLFTTTFPCHMCAKHIVASGIERVVFLEPYPKSLASGLHSDSIEVAGADRGQYSTFPSVNFEHFFGITPRRYREFFERTKRKDENGDFQNYKHGRKRPFIDVKSPFYLQFEDRILSYLYDDYLGKLPGWTERALMEINGSDQSLSAKRPRISKKRPRKPRKASR